MAGQLFDFLTETLSVVPFLQRVQVAMVESWDERCRAHIEQFKYLQYLAFAGLDGTIYGNSNAAEFPLTKEICQSMINFLRSEGASSFNFNGSNFVTVQKSPDHWMGKTKTQAMFLYLCQPYFIMATTDVSTQPFQASLGNNAVAQICEQYNAAGR
ncbi:hypothetical protein AHF37_07638 [Paragonimus kellicotti]|nr:hypothetical protein AHF37_07638 [Paragonimus kellicotti]